MPYIAIILGANLRWMPFYYRYEEILLKRNIKFDVLIWDREKICESRQGVNFISFCHEDKTNNHSPFKIIKFFQFAQFIKKTLRMNKYDKVIFLGTYAGIPALLSSFLRKHYFKRYWIDLRDITYETFKPFYYIEKKAIEKSFQTVVSSKGFISYIPSHDYKYMHNIDSKMDWMSDRYNKIESEQIRISYIGNIGFVDEVKKVLHVFADDSRFMLQFFGAKSEYIEEFCKNNEISNVEFSPAFEREKTVEFYNKTDIVYNVYGNNNINVKTALSNKLYYSIKFELPILVSEETFMEEFASQYGFGISFVNRDDFPDTLYKWYSEFIKIDHSRSFKKAWENILEEDKLAIEQLNCFLN